MFSTATSRFCTFELARQPARRGGLRDEGQRAFPSARRPKRAEHRPVVHRLRRRDRGVGVAHRRRQAIMPPLITSSGFTPKKAGFHSTRSASLPVSIEPTSCDDAVGDGRIDRVLGDVALDAEVVVARAVARQRAALRASSCAPSARCG